MARRKVKPVHWITLALLMLAAGVYLIPLGDNGKLAQALHDAARRGDVEAVRELLDRGADANAPGEFGAVPLHGAAANGHVAVTAILLAAGADPDAPLPANGYTPLYWAIENGHLEAARAVFATMGRALELEEQHLDAVTGLSASGPAFVYIIIEALAEGGVKVGLPRTVATELASQACLGAAKMVLETGKAPAQLKDDVTTPAGCTMDGILELEAGGLRVTLIKAVVEATRRAGELVR